MKARLKAIWKNNKKVVYVVINACDLLPIDYNIQ